MNQVIKQQLKNIEKQEQNILNKPENPLLESTISPFMEKVRGVIPEKLITTLNTAFYRGFQLIFEKGTTYIEKTYDKDKIQLEYDINNFAVDKKLSNKYIKRLDKQSKQSRLFNSSFSVLEGGILGLLGIGLPDIPLFLSVIVKTIYEISLSYGYQYDTPEEKTFVLLLICAANSKGELKREYDQKLEQLGGQLDCNIAVETDPEQQMKEAASVLSEALLTTKFIQGIPVVGAVGGIVNYNMIKKTGNYAAMKYKKRYLLKKSGE